MTTLIAGTAAIVIAGISAGAVAHIRKRLGLPALFTSGGRRINRELVGA